MSKTRTPPSRRGQKGRPILVKHKLGNRSVNRSALRMSTKELVEFVNTKTHRPRDIHKARMVLVQRGYDFTPVLVETPAEEVVAA